ncbi:uncharacterized protein [Haliotis asinina]|uniref:uncharacterized protein n=1 Tax=Haliotis asinina TaxID=109174 RepID=UPI00353232BF
MKWCQYWPTIWMSRMEIGSRQPVLNGLRGQSTTKHLSPGIYLEKGAQKHACYHEVRILLVEDSSFLLEAQTSPFSLSFVVPRWCLVKDVNWRKYGVLVGRSHDCYQAV